MLNVPQSEIDYVSQQIIQRSNFNEYQEYFDYARNALEINLPKDWQEADILFRKLLTVSENGT